MKKAARIALRRARHKHNREAIVRRVIQRLTRLPVPATRPVPATQFMRVYPGRWVKIVNRKS